MSISSRPIKIQCKSQITQVISLRALSHILDSISSIEKYTEGLTKEEFLANHLVQDGTIRQIEIIGEATKNISEPLKEKYPHITWKGITGMRDKLIHNYFGVDIDAVWDAVKKDIPILKDEILKIMEDLLKSI